MWKSVSLFLFVLLSTSSSLPLEPDFGRSTPQTDDALPTLATELQPPRFDAETASYSEKIIDESNRTLSTELEAPNEDAEIGDFGVDTVEPTISTELEPPTEDAEPFHSGAVYIINLFAIKNASTSEETNEILTDEFAAQNPTVLEPIATVLLVVEEDDEDKPVSLDELAKDLEAEGFKVEKIGEGETQLIKIDMDEIDHKDVELIKSGKLSKVRRRRTLGHGGGLLSKLLNKHSGGDSCQVCNSGYQQPQSTGIKILLLLLLFSVGYIPLVIVQQQPQQHYQQPQQHYQPAPQPHYQPAPQPHYQPHRITNSQVTDATHVVAEITGLTVKRRLNPHPKVGEQISENK
ncbi:GSCOCG00004300001-RA-CDS [Cotesia congregata]|nr:GSCOCG00004300001-RA-CDS [Cotesia congregata]